MHFIATFSDQTQFSGEDGNWDDCPDRGIVTLEVTLPFNIKKDGQPLPPSTVKLRGFDRYYFARTAKSRLNLRGGVAQVQDVGVVMAGIGPTGVVYVEIDGRGNVTNHLFTPEEFSARVSIKALRKGQYGTL